MNDSERKETKSGPSDTSPTEGVTGDNMSNDTRNHSYAIRKDGKQTDVPKNRRDEFDDNLISNDNMSDDPRTPPDAIEKNKKHTNETIDWYDKSVDDIMVSNPQT